MRKILERLLLAMTVVAALSACGARPDTQSTQQPVPMPVQPTVTAVGTAVLQQPTEPAMAPVSPPVVLPVATSRGPNLEATDPANVVLALGELQLVEFFRFT